MNRHWSWARAWIAAAALSAILVALPFLNANDRLHIAFSKTVFAAISYAAVALVVTASQRRIGAVRTPLAILIAAACQWVLMRVSGLALTTAPSATQPMYVVGFACLSAVVAACGAAAWSMRGTPVVSAAWTGTLVVAVVPVLALWSVGGDMLHADVVFYVGGAIAMDALFYTIGSAVGAAIAGTLTRGALTGGADGSQQGEPA